MPNVRSITPNEPANFTPELGNYKTLQPFRYWCQKVLPLVYDDSLSYYELLCKVVDYLNKAMEDVETLHGDVTNLHSAYVELQEYVNNYFSTLDVQEEINNKLDQMATDGSLFNVFSPYVANISQPKVVDNVAEMVNESYTYVLSTNGHIYQYKNDWHDTGLIFSTDIANYLGLKSPSVSDLNQITSAGIYFHGSSNETATNTPNDDVYGNAGFMVVCYYQNINRNYQMFYSYDTNDVYIRHQKGTSWTPWINLNLTSGSLPSSNINNILKTGSFFHDSTNEAATNTPNDAVYGNANFMVACYYLDVTHNYQMFYSYDTNAVYVRHRKGEGWSHWINFNITGDILPSNNLNNILESGSFFHGSSNEAAINTPNDDIYANAGFMIVCYYQNISRNYQMFYSYDTNDVYVRHQIYTGEFTKWTNLTTASSPNKVSISKLNDTNYNINFGKYNTNLLHTVNASINADLWNLSYINYNDVTVIPSGTDILGPIKEVGQTDFMGGVHGYEKTTSIYITIDGVEWDYNSDATGEVIQVVMVSELYRVSNKAHVYDRHVKLTITHNKIVVENMYTCVVDDSTIERATNGGLIAIRNTILKAVEMNNFFSSVAPTSVVSNRSKNNVGGTLFWENGSVTVENIIGKEQDTYSGYLNVFVNESPIRNKIYLDVISSNKKVENGESILGKFAITLA